MASCKRIKGSDKTQSLGNLNRNSMAGVNLSECEVAEQGRENAFLNRGSQPHLDIRAAPNPLALLTIAGR